MRAVGHVPRRDVLLALRIRGWQPSGVAQRGSWSRKYLLLAPTRCVLPGHLRLVALEVQRRSDIPLLGRLDVWPRRVLHVDLPVGGVSSSPESSALETARRWAADPLAVMWVLLAAGLAAVVAGFSLSGST